MASLPSVLIRGAIFHERTKNFPTPANNVVLHLFFLHTVKQNKQKKTVQQL
jgi:hypothetical protein